jgi:hypothetical protein
MIVALLLALLQSRTRRTLWLLLCSTYAFAIAPALPILARAHTARTPPCCMCSFRPSATVTAAAAAAAATAAAATATLCMFVLH